MNKRRYRTMFSIPYPAPPTTPSNFLEEVPVEQSVSIDIHQEESQYEIRGRVLYRYRWCYFLQGIGRCDGCEPEIARIDRTKEVEIISNVPTELIRNFIGPRYDTRFDAILNARTVEIISRQARIALNVVELAKPPLIQQPLIEIEDNLEL